ncbi:malate dehydrogenase [Candidatus Pseudothioglobus singularis]|jgi:malate dehydrogenase (oxaloacetate-decarboxylating)/malate dehydrogenase (oxaloacetate-decarboxylating)(NADP+)|uniref:malic enzyme-like NAD(P)-binding protein n=1 Tax=Candidatus Pseudothioglobus singularis TaxID=1427364 RepID=UPI000374739F|nr:malic enzyme-like NAD(P)-binding protein [Candidatus Pseudothioglobus singularis]ANQ66194.1 malate dehydrogenase [Candidatus Pseudothioglobus singularis]
MSKSLHDRALAYHKEGGPGKLDVTSHKKLDNDQDLSLAYSPGVAAPVREIAKDQSNVYQYTIKGNLVAVITDGSAVLGLGNVGPLAAKPVMEGKAVLFKHFAGINVFNIELDTQNVDEIVNTVKNIAPTFGGINLEDISAPRCFEIEERLIKELDIPVFHDDQHGTAIIVAAGLLNALEIQGKSITSAKIVVAGGGSAGIATLDLLVNLGFKKENMILVDRRGVVSKEQISIVNKYKAAFAVDTSKKTLGDAIDGADVLIGVARGNLVTQAMIKSMAKKPIIFALSNPDPEISVEDVFACRDDALMATGRSDFPNQVNNVIGFPYIFRGALDANSKIINTEMKVAAVHAIKDLAKLPAPQSLLEIYQVKELSFGKDYFIPKPFDPRLIDLIPKAIFDAAVKSGVSRLK